MTGYTRSDGGNIDGGNLASAADLDAEFDALEDAFDSSTGHAHDGTAAEGAPITVIGPAQEYVATATDFYPKTDNTYNLGQPGNRWQSINTAGTMTGEQGNFEDVNITSGTATVSLSASGISSGTDRTFTFPDDGSGEIVTTFATQTLTGKLIPGSVNTITVDGTYGIGFRGIPVNDNGGVAFSNYDPVSTDKDKVLAGSGSIVMPSSTFVVGDRFYFYAQSSLTFDTSSVTCQVEGNASTQASVTLANDSWGEALLIDTSPYTWLFRGAFS